MRSACALALLALAGCAHAPSAPPPTKPPAPPPTDARALPENARPGVRVQPAGDVPELELASACHPGTKVTLAPMPRASLAALRPEDSVTLSRSACFGRCPVYSVTLRANGEVSANGERYVAAKGPATWTIDPPLARRVLAELVKEHVFTLSASMSTQVTDLPGARLEVSLGGRSGAITHYGAGAELDMGVAGPDNAALTRLEQLVDFASEVEARVVGCPVDR